jgi:hypothetical protein
MNSTEDREPLIKTKEVELPTALAHRRENLWLNHLVLVKRKQSPYIMTAPCQERVRSSHPSSPVYRYLR